MSPHKKITSKKLFIFSLAFVLLLLCPLKKTQAAAWPVMDPLIKQGYEQIMKIIQDIILGTAKQKAAQSLNSSISSLIGGSSTSGAKFITDWTDFLVTAPTTAANTYMNDYLSQITSGRGSSSGYEGVGGGSYQTTMVTSAKSLTTGRTRPTVTYSGSPSTDLFSGNNFNNLNSYLSGVNNPWAFNANAQIEYGTYLAQQQATAMAQGIAYQGFKGTSQSGYITNPGSLIMQNMANVQNIPNNILANAKSISEVITSIVQQTISQAIQNGIGQVQSSVQKEVTSVTNQASSTLNSQVSSYGPAALYNKATK